MEKKFFTQRNPEDVRHFCFLFFVICVLSFAHHAKADSWTQKANYPGAGQELPIAFSIGDKGYAGCGTGAHDFWEYDPAADTWTQMADIPGPDRRAGIGFSIGDKGYAGTGDGPLNDFYEYDPAANTWTQKASMTTARNFAEAFAIGDKGYVGGGNYVNDFWEYDPSTDTWTQESNLPYSWWGHAAAFSVGGNGYFSTGLAPGTIAETWEYDPAANSWTQRADMPGGTRSDARGFAICDKGYVMTGGEGPYYNDLWEYDHLTDTWTQKTNIPSDVRDDGGSFAIGNKGYFGLGQLNGGTNTSDFYEYTPDDVCNINMLNFAASDSAFCQNFCINFFDSSQNNPTAWQWDFPGGNPSSSTDQNPTNICYYTAGTYDVMLITTSASGNDTLTFANYITVFSAPSLPTITQAGNTLTSSAAASYQWQFNSVDIPGATNQSYTILQTGFYTVVVTDSNGCTNSATIFINYNQPTNFAASDTDICEKFCITFFDSSQNNPTSWLWEFPGGNPSSSTDQNPTNICYNTPGIYDVTLITTGANGNDTLVLSGYITVYTNPFAPVISQVGNTLTSTPATSYQWQLNSVDIPGATNQSYTITQSGLYTVIIGDDNGCTAQADIDATYVGIDEIVENAMVNIYPNPSSGSFMVEFSYAQASENRLPEIDVVNTLGQKVFSSTEKNLPDGSQVSSSNFKKEIDLSDVARGVYFIEIKTENEFVRKKMVIAE